MLYDYTKGNRGVNDLQRLGIELQSPNPQSVVTAIRYDVSADYYYPDYGYLADFITICSEIMLIWPGIEPTTQDLNSQLSAFDHSDMATQ